MHPNPIFHTGSAPGNLAFAGQRAFGTLCVNGAEGPLVSHVPILLGDGIAELHLVRSNPIARALESPLPAVIAVQGPDSYISPDWYDMPDQVPTWNYVAVHLRGTLERRPQVEMVDLLARQSAEYEGRLEKAPWTMDKMTPEALEKLLRMIVPCRMRIGSVDGTWKFSQNKPDAARQSAAEGVRAAGFGSETAELADRMRDA